MLQLLTEANGQGVARTTIAKRTGQPLQNIGVALAELLRRGRVERVERGVWRCCDVRAGTGGLTVVGTEQ